MENLRIRTATAADARAAAAVEAACFPPAEAATPAELTERIRVYGSHFWLLERGGRLVAFVDGMTTDRPDLTDEMYAGDQLYDPQGPWLMIFGVASRPDCRGKGYPSQLMERAIQQAKAQGRAGLVLTCKERLLPYYARFGFVNEGVSSSAHGGAVWYQMRLAF